MSSELVLVELDDLKRIESIARNALPPAEKVCVITHIHAEIEKVLESALDTPDWWFK